PRLGQAVEAYFDYMQEQPTEAFDPDRFAQGLSASGSNANGLYALLKDPGGQALTPADLFKAGGHHMPTLARAGRTPEGIIWVESTNSTNRQASGRIFYGFGKLTDNLGQDYVRRWIGNAVEND